MLLTLLILGSTALGCAQDTQPGCYNVTMREEGVCEDREVEECSLCHTVHTRDCTITMKKVLVPHKYKKCWKTYRQERLCVEEGESSCQVR